jgi:hypothetical protein
MFQIFDGRKKFLIHKSIDECCISVLQPRHRTFFRCFWTSRWKFVWCSITGTPFLSSVSATFTECPWIKKPRRWIKILYVFFMFSRTVPQNCCRLIYLPVYHTSLWFLFRSSGTELEEILFVNVLTEFCGVYWTLSGISEFLKAVMGWRDRRWRKIHI